MRTKTKVYLVLVTWPNGTEGLLFPRPGNVQLADTPEQGQRDIQKAIDDLGKYAAGMGEAMLPKITIRLVAFQRLETVKEFTYEREPSQG